VSVLYFMYSGAQKSLHSWWMHYIFASFVLFAVKHEILVTGTLWSEVWPENCSNMSGWLTQSGSRKPRIRRGPGSARGKGHLLGKHTRTAGLSSRVVGASDCGVRGPRLESRRRLLCLSQQQLLRYTALGTGCAPLLQCLGRLCLPPSVGR